MSEFETKLAAVLGRHIDGFKELVSAERLSGGASQETYRLKIRDAAGERRLCVRRAPGGLAPMEGTGRPGLRIEAMLMRVAREAGVPEPEVYAIFEAGDDLGEGFVMEWLDGEALGARIVRSESLDAIRPRLAFEFGKVLAKLHAIDLDKSGLRPLLETFDPDVFVQRTWDQYQLLQAPQPMIDYAGRWLKEHLPKNPRMALVHSDFRNGNVMVSPQGVVAVLDWELAHIGDPMRDLGWVCTNSWRFGRTDLPVGGFGHYEDLFRGYESVSGIKVDPDHVKFWEVFGSFWWAVGCLGMAQHYRSGPDKTVERPGIGRRTSECQVDCVNLLMPGPVTLIENTAPPSSLDMPRIDELVTSVRDYLREEVMKATEGRINFLARVASNSMDIVLRELNLGPGQRAQELQRLRALFKTEDDLETLRWRLVRALRDGSMPLDAPGLDDYLRQTVVNQVAIDQPVYSGFKTAISRKA